MDRCRVVDAHRAGKGYKTISNLINSKCTVRQIVYKWRKSKAFVSLLKGRGQPTTVRSLQEQCIILCKGAKEHKVTAKLQIAAHLHFTMC